MAFSNEPRETAHHSPMAKVPTGISGMDEILLGGLPQGRTTIVAGGPGTGKTVLGLEFLYRGALDDKPGVFVTFEESAEAVHRHAQALGWGLQALEDDGRLLVMHADMPVDLLISGEFEIDALLAILDGQVQALGARRIVIDAVDVLLRIFKDRFRRENQLYVLHKWLLEQGLTALVTAKRSNGEAAVYHILDYLADCVLLLDQRVQGQVATRRLRVLKYRGSDFLSNEYPYVITSSGIELMPVSTTQLQQVPLGLPVSTGISQLDVLLGGGFRRASCVLITGAGGTGKTTLAFSFSVAACHRGERVLYISFEESKEVLTNTMLSTGIDVRSAVAADQLRILTAMPESMGVEEHLLLIFRTIEDFGPDHLVVDAISACHRMGTGKAALDFLVRLIGRCKQKGITCVLTDQADPFSTSLRRFDGIDISSLVDTLLRLEQTWSQNAHERRLLIIKSRGSRHSHEFHTFTISDQGIGIIMSARGSAAAGRQEAQS